jgi:iron complex outermembrane receptor protein
MSESTRLIILTGLCGLLASPGAGVAAEPAGESGEPAVGALQEITVTANRREQHLQDVPISVSAYSAEDLRSTGVTNIQDLPLITPGLSMTQQSGALTPYIRGIGAADNTVGQEAAVSTYVDGVYYPSVYGALFSFNNIDRIEVLKGPQGTLFGRNATGGLIQVITRTPSATPSIEGNVSYGNYGTTNARLYGTAGVGEMIAADLAVVFQRQENGFGHDVTTGTDVGFLPNEVGLRNKWLITPTDRTTATVSFDYVNSGNGDLGNVKNFLPGAVGIDGQPATPGYYNTRSDVSHEYVHTRQWGGALSLNQQFDAFELQSITSHRDTRVTQNFDNDATELAVLNAYVDDQKTKTTTQELRISSSPGSAIKWTGGVYGFWDQSGFQGPLGLGLFGASFGGTGALLKNTIRTKSYSVYSDATFPLTSLDELTVGARWTHDTRNISGITDIADSDQPPTNTILMVPVPSGNFSAGKPTWRVVFDHKLVQDTMVYASYNRGFKSGNFNTVSPADAPFQAETVDAFEAGIKSELLEHRVRVNVAGFYYKYKNLQLPSLSGSFLLTTNAANSEIKGVDFDGQFLPVENLKLSVGASFLDSKYTSFPAASCSVREPDGTTLQGTCNAQGKELSRSPKITANVGATYTIPSQIGPFSLSANYAYNGKFYWEPDNRLQQDAYSLLNTDVSWTTADEHFGLDLFAKNLTNSQYAVWIVAFALGDEYAAAPPRTYGAGFHFKF